MLGLVAQHPTCQCACKCTLGSSSTCMNALQHANHRHACSCACSYPFIRILWLELQVWQVHANTCMSIDFPCPADVENGDLDLLCPNKGPCGSEEGFARKSTLMCAMYLSDGLPDVSCLLWDALQRAEFEECSTHSAVPASSPAERERCRNSPLDLGA